jgi:hypothetical protein
MEQGRERVSAQRIGFGKHDIRPVCDNAIPDRMHRAYPSYLVHSNFQHRITSRATVLYIIWSARNTRMRATPRAKYLITSYIIFKKEIAGKPRARVTRWPLAAAFSI